MENNRIRNIIFIALMLIIFMIVFHMWKDPTYDNPFYITPRLIKSTSKNPNKKSSASRTINIFKSIQEQITQMPSTTVNQNNFLSINDNQYIKCFKENNIKAISSNLEKYLNAYYTNEIKCPYSERIGSSGDGGWDVCLAGTFNLKKKAESEGCLVYTFGVGGYWGFDDEIATKYNCTVRAFDHTENSFNHSATRPSGVHFYKWGIGDNHDTITNSSVNEVFSLKSIRKFFNESNKIIDVLKIDVEGAEWNSFNDMFRTGEFKTIKQVAMETHSYLDTISTDGEVMKKLSSVGLKRWMYHNNPACSFNYDGDLMKRCPNQISHCVESYFINVNFLKHN